VLVSVLLLLAASHTAAQSTASGPRIVVSKMVVDLGSVARGTEATAVFEIENAGSEPLQLRSLSTSCACAVADFDQVIAPGTKGRFEIKVDTSMLAGASQSQVTVGTNDPETPQVVLTAKVDSRSYLSVEPGYIRYDVHQNFPGDGIIEQLVWANDAADFEITGVRTDLKIGNRTFDTKATFRPAEESERRANTPGPQWKVAFQLPSDAPIGSIAGWLRIDTSHPQQKTAHLPVTGFIRPVFAVTPAAPKYQFVQSELAKEAYTHRLHVKNFAAEGIAISALRTDVEGLELSYETEEEGRVYYVLVTATGALPTGKYSGKLFIDTASEMSGTIEVPLQFHVVP
jgi:hypothetical protein